MLNIDKKLKRKCGIYKIINTINNKFYIGSSIDLQERLQCHRSELRGNYHDNKHLQNSWNKYGEENFIYDIIEFCSPSIRFDRELFYITTLKPLYNIILENIYLPSRSQLSRLKLSQTRKRLFLEGKLKISNCTKLYVYDLHGNFVKLYDSKISAVRDLNLTGSAVDRVLRGEYLQHKGYMFSRQKVNRLLPYVKKPRILKLLMKTIIVENESEYYEFECAKCCCEYFKVHIVYIRDAIKHKRYFLKKYKIYYKSAVSLSNL